VSVPGLYLVTEDLARTLVCLDAQTGEVHWTFQVPDDRPPSGPMRADRAPFIVSGLPSVAVVGEEVLVLSTSPTAPVRRLSLKTGELLAAARPPIWGVYVVTERSIFFKQAFALSEFDHREMREVDRLEYRAEVEPLYKGQDRMVCGMCLTEESVVWTTMQGALMGVSRKRGPDGRRVTWTDHVGGLIPLGVPPVAFGDYLYYASRAGDGLRCYRSVHSTAST
jgi:hypothetical protein